MAVRLEHANLSVRDIEGMIRFLRAAFPEFHVRGDGVCNDTRWVHIGTSETYIALNQAKTEPERRWTPYAGMPGVNHLGCEVDDVDALRGRLKSAGYKESTPPNKHPYRTRVYFYDPEGNDWEFVQYPSEDPVKRHEYKLPDR